MISKTDISGPLRPSPDPAGSIVRVMRQCATSPWTEERIEHVKTRWSQGASARQIARELGNAVSRSAVLGKVHRLGIAQSSPNCGAREHRLERKNARRAPASAHKPIRERDAAGASAESRRQIPAWVRDAEPYIDDPLVDAGIPFHQRRVFLELSGRSCRWPVGDPRRSDFFFCGAEALPGKPYCVAHCARAYRPAEDATQRALSSHLRLAMLKYRGVDTYIKLGGETAADIQSTGEGEETSATRFRDAG
jgi:GcrA cell cycle regulator